MLINSYSPDFKFKNFPNLRNDISGYYDKIYDTAIELTPLTPRYRYESGLKIGVWDIFYYIDRLYDNNPSNVIDVGCGECIWKKWFPHIIGFDPNTYEFSNQDFVDYFDKDFSKGHTKNYDVGMALNSLHFVDWKNISDQINLAMNIVNDRFLFTFNFEQVRAKPTRSVRELIPLFDNIIASLDYEIVLLDYPILRGCPPYQAGLNGDVRFILSHKK